MSRDNHNTEVVRELHRPDEMHYRALCSCGWEGEQRREYGAADDDSHAHIMAVIPDDMPGSIYH